MSMAQVIARINTIEERFAVRPSSKMPAQNMPDGKSFADTLSQIEKQNDTKDSTKASFKNTVSGNTGAGLSADPSKKEIASLIEATALKYGVNPQLALAVAQTESNLSQSAVSPVGAVGVMQLMPGTASDLGVANINSAADNIDGGVRYLKQMLNTFGGDVNKALAAYNAGPGAVQKYNGIPPYKETEEYVSKINKLFR